MKTINVFRMFLAGCSLVLFFPIEAHGERSEGYREPSRTKDGRHGSWRYLENGENGTDGQHGGHGGNGGGSVYGNGGNGGNGGDAD